MKSKSLLSTLAAGAFALASLNASANTITVDYSSGGVFNGVDFTWTYNVLFANSELLTYDPTPKFTGNSFFELADVAGFVGGSVAGVPAGWALTTPATGSGIGPGGTGNSDSGAINNLVFTWTGANVESPANFTFTFHSIYGATVDESFSSQDRVLLVGAGDGGNSFAGGHLLVPVAPSVPDGGTTVMLLGAALAGLGLLRKKLIA